MILGWTRFTPKSQKTRAAPALFPLPLSPRVLRRRRPRRPSPHLCTPSPLSSPLFTPPPSPLSLLSLSSPPRRYLYSVRFPPDLLLSLFFLLPSSSFSSLPPLLLLLLLLFSLSLSLPLREVTVEIRRELGPLASSSGDGRFPFQWAPLPPLFLPLLFSCCF